MIGHQIFRCPDACEPSPAPCRDRRSRRCDVESDDLRKDEAADHSQAQAASRFGPRAEANRDRQGSRKGGHGRHHNRPEANQGTLMNGLFWALSFGALCLQGKVNHHDGNVPSFPRPPFITDTAVNIYPSVEEKLDIVQNAINLAQALGIETPKVALLSAQEMISPKLISTLDAAVLCKMAGRGQITGAVLDGPLGFDVALSAEAARSKHVVSPVAGHPDIFLVPNLEAGNMLTEELERLSDAQVAGLVLGARVPIILTSRTDTTLTRLGSCALALLLVAHQRFSARSMLSEALAA